MPGGTDEEFTAAQSWARDLVRRMESNSGPGGGWINNNSRRLIWEIAAAENSESEIGMIGQSWRLGVRRQRQRWTIGEGSPWRDIVVMHVFPARGARWKPMLSDLPVFSSQVPPPARTAERDEFDRAVVAGWDDNEDGISTLTSVLKWRGMEALGMSAKVVRESRFGIEFETTGPVTSYHFGVEGQYPEVWAARGELVTEEQGAKNPRGGPAEEGPLSYVPIKVCPYVVVEKIKPSGKVAKRICFNHSGSGLNALLEKQEVLLPTVNDFARLCQPGDILGKQDGKSAFVHHPINSVVADLWGHRRLTDGGYYRRRQLDFGTAIGPAVAQRLADESTRILSEKWQLQSVTYTDDKAFPARDHGEMRRKRAQLRMHNRTIGYETDPDKDETGETITFLGVDVSTTNGGFARLPQSKRDKYRESAEALLAAGQAERGRLASIVGQLNFASSYTAGGASHLPSLFRCVHGEFVFEEELSASERLEEGFTSDIDLSRTRAADASRMRVGHIKTLFVKELPTWRPTEVVPLSVEAREDLRWWVVNLRKEGGVRLHLDCPSHRGRWDMARDFGHHAQLDKDQQTAGGVPVLTTDACLSEQRTAGGAAAGNSLYVINLTDEHKRNIGIAELATAIHTIEMLAPLIVTARDRRVLVRSDSPVVVFCLRRGTSSQPIINAMIRRHAQWCCDNDIEVATVFIPGKLNNIADALSRGTLQPDCRIIALTASALAEIAKTIPDSILVFPGHDGESPGSVWTRQWQWRHASWLDRHNRGKFNVFLPPFDEMGACLASLLSQHSHSRTFIVIVSADQKAQQQQWWRQYRLHAATRTCLPSPTSAMLPSIRHTAQPPSVGEWRAAGSVPMEAWVFRGRDVWRC